eukprot:2254510-Rhodomonas_salina.1
MPHCLGQDGAKTAEDQKDSPVATARKTALGPYPAPRPVHPCGTLCKKKPPQQRGTRHSATPPSALPRCTVRRTALRTAAVQPTVGPCPKNTGLSLALYRAARWGCLRAPRP